MEENKEEKEDKEKNLEEECIDEEEIPRFRIIKEKSVYCAATRFKCVKEKDVVLEQSDIIKKKLKCPYFGNLVFILGNSVYALNCKNEQGIKNKESSNILNYKNEKDNKRKPLDVYMYYMIFPDLEKRCESLGLPKYRVRVAENHFYCEMSKFKCSNPDFDPQKIAEQFRKDCSCQYFGKLIDFGGDIYALVCNNQKQQRRKKK